MLFKHYLKYFIISYYYHVTILKLTNGTTTFEDVATLHVFPAKKGGGGGWGGQCGGEACIQRFELMRDTSGYM